MRAVIISRLQKKIPEHVIMLHLKYILSVLYFIPSPFFLFCSALNPKWTCHPLRGHTDISKNSFSDSYWLEHKEFQMHKATPQTLTSFLNQHIQITPPPFFFNWTNEVFLLHCNNQYKPHDAAVPKIELPAEHTAWPCFQEEQGKESSSVLLLWEFWSVFSYLMLQG